MSSEKAVKICIYIYYNGISGFLTKMSFLAQKTGQKNVDKSGVMVYNEQYIRGRKGFDGDYEAR